MELGVANVRTFAAMKIATTRTSRRMTMPVTSDVPAGRAGQAGTVGLARRPEAAARQSLAYVELSGNHRPDSASGPGRMRAVLPGSPGLSGLRGGSGTIRGGDATAFGVPDAVLAGQGG